VTPLPGDFLVTPTYGNWRDRAAAWLIRYGTDSPVNHAALYVGAVDGYVVPQVVEAWPSGARLSAWNSHPDCTWSTGRLPEGLVPGDVQRERVVHAALGMVGVPYGWLDLVAITFAQKRLGQPVDGDEWWVRRIQSGRTLICSQLVDRAYLSGGVHLFDDGRPDGLVSPGDLWRLLQPAG
jgi:uncharacterized protein YycO